MPKMKVPAKLENLEKLQKFITDFAVNHGFSAKRIMEIELACEEALVNIFNYAYPEDYPGDVEIVCKVDQNEDIIIEMVDAGQPFNMISIPDPDIKEDISERKIGGLGTVLIKQFVDKIDYRRDKDKNFLAFRFCKQC
jgi:serine/threonine-protein kinase RsbW